MTQTRTSTINSQALYALVLFEPMALVHSLAKTLQASKSLPELVVVYTSTQGCAALKDAKVESQLFALAKRAGTTLALVVEVITSHGCQLYSVSPTGDGVILIGDEKRRAYLSQIDVENMISEQVQKDLAQYQQTAYFTCFWLEQSVQANVAWYSLVLSLMPHAMTYSVLCKTITTANTQYVMNVYSSLYVNSANDEQFLPTNGNSAFEGEGEGRQISRNTTFANIGKSESHQPIKLTLNAEVTYVPLGKSTLARFEFTVNGKVYYLKEAVARYLLAWGHGNNVYTQKGEDLALKKASAAIWLSLEGDTELTKYYLACTQGNLVFQNRWQIVDYLLQKYQPEGRDLSLIHMDKSIGHELHVEGRKIFGGKFKVECPETFLSEREYREKFCQQEEDITSVMFTTAKGVFSGHNETEMKRKCQDELVECGIESVIASEIVPSKIGSEKVEGSKLRGKFTLTNVDFTVIGLELLLPNAGE